jgi:hypothetical protein
VSGAPLSIPKSSLILVATAPTDSARADAASSVFGLGVLLADIGLIIFGVAAIRAAAPRVSAAWAVGLGAFQLLVVTPVVLAARFASTAAFVVITVQDGLIALLGGWLCRQVSSA